MGSWIWHVPHWQPHSCLTLWEVNLINYLVTSIVATPLPISCPWFYVLLFFSILVEYSVFINHCHANVKNQPVSMMQYCFHYILKFSFLWHVILFFHGKSLGSCFCSCLFMNWCTIILHLTLYACLMMPLKAATVNSIYVKKQLLLEAQLGSSS